MVGGMHIPIPHRKNALTEAFFDARKLDSPRESNFHFSCAWIMALNLGMLYRIFEFDSVSWEKNMIEDSHAIIINAKPSAVYKYIEEMETKFPIYSFLDYRPLVALRLIIIGEPKDGFRMLLHGRKYFHKRRGENKIMALGNCYGPFELIESVRGEKYWFKLKTRLGLFDLEAGYLLEPVGEETLLSLALVSPSPNSIQRLYWCLVNPVHKLFSKKVLSVIKSEFEG